NLTPANGAMTRLLGDLTQRYGAIPGSSHAGHAAALKQLWELAYREASTLAYADAFRAIMLAFRRRHSSGAVAAQCRCRQTGARAITLRSSSSRHGRYGSGTGLRFAVIAIVFA